MAYDDYSMGGYIPGDYETEEDRRKRLLAEQAQAQAQDLESGGITAQRPSLGDMASQYIGRRVDAAQQRVADAGQIITDPQAALERRMGMPEQPVEPTPVKQTITTDPATGEQKMTISGSVQDLSAANPLTPTVTGPAVPTVERETAQPPAAQAQQVAQAPAVPNIPQGLVAGGGVPERPDIGQVPAPGTGTQVAGPVNPAAPAGEQVASYKHPSEIPENRAPVVQQAPAGAPGASLQQIAQAEQTPEDRARQAVVDAHNIEDPEKRRQAMANILATGDEASKRLAHSFIAEDYLKQKNLRDAEKKIETATPTELARYMKERSPEGSYVKAILFARLGLTDLAKREQQLLNPDVKMDTTTVGSDKYTVVRDENGGVVKAFDVDGKEVGQKTLAKISAAAMPTKAHLLPSVHGTPVQNAQGEGGFRMYDPQTNSSYVLVGNERRPDIGFTLPTQNVQNVYNAAGATQQAKQAAETGKPQGPLPPVAGGQQSAAVVANGLGLSQQIASGTRTTEQQQAMYDESVAAGRPGKTAQGATIAKPGTSEHEGGAAIDYPTRLATPEDIAKLKAAGFVQTAPNTSPNHWSYRPQGGGGAATSSSYLETKENIKVGGEVTADEQKKFNTSKQKYAEAAEVGREVADVTRTQMTDILSSPEMIGYLTGDSTRSAQVGKLIREVATGAYNGGDDAAQKKQLADDMVKANLPMPLQSKLQAFQQANTRINALTLRSNEGPGAISNFENKQNQNNNMTNVGDLTPWAIGTGLSKRQFVGDLAAAKQQFLAANEGQFKNDTQFESAWSKKRDIAMKGYEGIYQARLQAVKPYYDAANTEAARTNPQLQQQYRDAAVAAFRSYPAPDWNPQTGKWEYRTKQAREAAMNAIAGVR